MNNTEDPRPLAHAGVPALLQPLLAVAYAVVTPAGRVLAANDGFYLLLGLPGGTAVDDVSSYLINPGFGDLAERAMAAADGRIVHHGLLTFVDAEGNSRSLSGTVSRRGDQVELLGEHDVQEHERLFSTVMRLNEELAEQQRAVIRINRELQREKAEQAALLAQLEAVRKRLLQAEKMEAIGLLAGGVAHDFNNILVAVLGFAELAQKEFGSAIPKLDGYLAHCLRAGRRAKDLVDQLLAFSRNAPADAGPLAPGPVVEETVNMLRSTLPSSLSMTLNMPEELPLVRIDPVQLHQVVTNLCINARDAAGGRGRLDIALAAARGLPATSCASCHKSFDGDYLTIFVRDDGTGIPAAHVDHIFDPFFTTKEVGKGTGMGLSVVHGIVHFNDGHVTVATNEDGGAEFAVYLPIAPSGEEG